MALYRHKNPVYKWPLNQGTTTISSFAPILVSNTNANRVIHSSVKWADSDETTGEHTVDVWMDVVSATNTGELKATMTLGASTTNRSFYVTVSTGNAPVRLFESQPLGSTDKLWVSAVSSTNQAFILRGFATIWE